MHEKGDGVTQDYVTAYSFFIIADTNGHENAGKARDRLAEKMTAEQIAEAQRRARAWKPKTWEELKRQLDRIK